MVHEMFIKVQEEANVLMFNAGRDDLFKCSNVQREEETTCPRFNHRIADMPHVPSISGFSAFDTQVLGFTLNLCHFCSKLNDPGTRSRI